MFRVTTAAEAAARDRAAIAAGISAFDLMLAAGTVAAAEVLRRFGHQLGHGVALFAGTGNNGGDAYVAAAQLARAGVTVRLHAAGPPRTPDAIRAAALAAPALVHGAPGGHERVVIDGLLGTGHQGPLRREIAAACVQLRQAFERGAVLVALDVPTGLDATTGAIAAGSMPAHVTICFGTLKRGVLLQRAHAGAIVVADIGLDGVADRPGDDDDAAWRWAHGHALAARVPAFAWNAHKGTRGRVGLAGGHEGMAGAVVLAARAALRGGAGLVHALVDPASVPAVQALVPQALVHRWPMAFETADDGQHTRLRLDALAIGPGLGRSARSAATLEWLLGAHRGTPLVLDADALWLAADAAQRQGADAASALRRWTREVPHAVCTPHAGEFARLTGAPWPDAWQARADRLRHFADTAGVTVLLKGTPTLVAAPGSASLQVVPHGTALLATGGSGDCLTGIIATLLAQGVRAEDAAVVGATLHGVAAEHATVGAGVRGGTLDDMLEAMPAAWRALERPAMYPPGVLATLPAPA
ncbi:MAG: NAD(P)H-hydrate dehydratase [Gemmatimonadaceae bacterium]